MQQPAVSSGNCKLLGYFLKKMLPFLGLKLPRHKKKRPIRALFKKILDI